jgi:hypothetical protein
MKSVTSGLLTDHLVQRGCHMHCCDYALAELIEQAVTCALPVLSCRGFSTCEFLEKGLDFLESENSLQCKTYF